MWSTIITKQLHDSGKVYDWSDEGFGKAFALYLFLVTGFQLNYLYLYFVCGTRELFYTTIFHHFNPTRKAPSHLSNLRKQSLADPSHHSRRRASRHYSHRWSSSCH